MATKVLDSTFLIDYWRGEASVAEYLDEHENRAEYVTTTITVKEIAVGRAIQGHLDDRDILGTFDWLRIVPFDIEHAFIAAELEARLHRDEDTTKAQISAVSADVLIAAVAKELGAPVVTRNGDDFERFDVVAVESY